MNLKSDLPVVQVIHSMGAAGACCVRISSSVDGYTHVIMVRLLGGITSSPRLVELQLYGCVTAKRERMART
jgi:hypothetical protein